MRYWPWYLFLVAIVFQGAKTPGTFLVWGALALLCCCYILLKHSTPIRMGSTALIFVILLIAAQIFSLDSNASLFQTTQGLLYVLLWICLTSDLAVWGSDRVIWTVLSMAALTTLVITSYQIGTRQSPSGFLPLNPNFNAAWMASFAAAFFARDISTSSLGDLERTFGRMLIAAAILLLAIGHSRSGVVALVGSVVYILAPSLDWKKWGLVVLSIVVLLAVFPLHASILFSKGIHAYRPEIWQTALAGLGDHPLTGYGLSNFELAYQKHAFPVILDAVRYARTTQFAHNEFLQAACEMGLPSAFLLVFCIGSLLFHKGKRTPEKAGFVALIMTALFNPVWHMPFLVYLTLLWAVLIARGVPRPQLYSRSSRLRTGMLIYTGFVGLLLSWFGLRHHWEVHQAWESIIRWNPRDGEAWENWAWQQNDPSLRLHGLSEAVQRSPHQLYFHEAYAGALENSLRPENIPLAWQEYETALREAPRRAIDALSLGRLCYRLKDPAEALTWFQKAHAWEPCYWEADLWIARSLYILGRKGEAVDTLENLVRQRTYLVQHPNEFIIGDSTYEQLILSYNNQVVEQDLTRFLSH